VKRIRRIHELLKEQADGGGVAAFDHFLAAEENLTNGVRDALDRQLFVDRADEIVEGVVYADDFLAFNHEAKMKRGRAFPQSRKWALTRDEQEGAPDVDAP
jgi:hypothetical protein